MMATANECAPEETDPWTALGDPTRRAVFAEVVRSPQPVTDIARRFPVSRPAVSQHLKVLAEARLVTATKVGRQRIYAARADGLAVLRAELDRFWGDALTNFKQLAERGDTEGAHDARSD